MPQVLITGANGFIGKHLLNCFSSNSHWRAVAASRTGISTAGVETRIMISGFSPERYHNIVAGCDAIVHTAARAHILQETAQDPPALYREINVDITRSLAQAAINAGVKHFIFISSAGVHGSKSQKPFTEVDMPQPETDYARSKLEAEQALLTVAEATSMKVTILRLPLVYGPNVKGNFLSMLKVLDKRLPLPLGSINNSRSLLYIDNLLDFIIRSLDHPRATNETFLLSDTETVSTSALLRIINSHLGNKAWIFSLPEWLLNLAALVMNKRQQLEKLTASFELDCSKAQHLLDWHAPVSLHSGIESTSEAYRAEKPGERPYD